MVQAPEAAGLNKPQLPVISSGVSTVSGGEAPRAEGLPQEDRMPLHRVEGHCRPDSEGQAGALTGEPRAPREHLQSCSEVSESGCRQQRPQQDSSREQMTTTECGGADPCRPGTQAKVQEEGTTEEQDGRNT